MSTLNPQPVIQSLPHLSLPWLFIPILNRLSLPSSLSVTPTPLSFLSCSLCPSSSMQNIALSSYKPKKIWVLQIPFKFFPKMYHCLCYLHSLIPFFLHSFLLGLFSTFNYLKRCFKDSSQMKKRWKKIYSHVCDREYQKTVTKNVLLPCKYLLLQSVCLLLKSRRAL